MSCKLCCSVLHCVALCCSVLQFDPLGCRICECDRDALASTGTSQETPVRELWHSCVAVCCSVLQCVAVCCSVLQCVAACSVCRETCVHEVGLLAHS